MLSLIVMESSRLLLADQAQYLRAESVNVI